MQSGVVYNIQRMSIQDGPGLRTTVFLKGCPLQCLWCSNPESQSFYPELLVFEDLCRGCGKCEEVCPHGAVTVNGMHRNRDLSICQNCGKCPPKCPAKARVMSGKLMTVEEVMHIVRKDELFYANSDGGVTFSGGEPTSAGEFLIGLLETCRMEGYHTCVDTCGYCSPEHFKRVLGLTELIYFDCKHMDPEEHRKLTGKDNALILSNLQEALRSKVPVHVRIPLMPDLNDSHENIAAMADMLRKYGKEEVDILPSHAFGRSKYSALGRTVPCTRDYETDELKEVLDRFSRNSLKVNVIS